mmetsp:Transcript_2482/g.2873  ORF Transcript_2482/g.2873 Transcript_2482/m.2873 type:complete len:80 (+) Transcript_2482:141-380(+)
MCRIKGRLASRVGRVRGSECDSLVMVVVKLEEVSDIGKNTLSDSRRTYIDRSKFVSAMRQYKGLGYIKCLKSAQNLSVG